MKCSLQSTHRIERSGGSVAESPDSLMIGSLSDMTCLPGSVVLLGPRTAGQLTSGLNKRSIPGEHRVSLVLPSRRLWDKKYNYGKIVSRLKP